jgi:hypothetical protein
LALAACGAGSSMSHADATLVYSLRQTGVEPVEKTLSIARFFARVDSADENGRYLLFQAGKFFPLYDVNGKAGIYTRLTPPVQANLGPEARTQSPQPQSATDAGEAHATSPDGGTAADTSQGDRRIASPAEGQEAEPGEQVTAAETGDAVEQPEVAQEQQEPTQPPAPPTPQHFKATKDMDEVAGIRCRIVVELIEGEPAIEHCMANKAALGTTERETRTLARLFAMARERGFDWLGTATQDEEFVSIRSRDPKRNRTLSLTSISTKPLPSGHLRVPEGFTEAKRDPGPKPAAPPAPSGPEKRD